MSFPKENWLYIDFSESYTAVSTAKNKIKQRDYLTTGIYPVIDQGSEQIGGYYNDSEYVIQAEPPFIIFGDHTRVVKYIDFPFVPGADGIKVLKPHNFYDPKLFYYFVKQLPLPDKGYARHFQHLSKSKIPLPPLPEQRAILAKLETLLCELDNTVASLKQAKEQIKTYRQSVLKAAFTGKLTEEWRKQNAKKALWKETTFGKIVPSMRRGPFGSSIKKSLFVDIGYKVYEQQNAIKKDYKLGSYYINQEKYLELDGFKVNPGDYIVSCAGTMGELYRLPINAPDGVINQALLRLRIDANEVLDTYFEYYFYYPAFRASLFKDSKGTAMKNLAEIKSLKWIPIFLPTLHEQQQIIVEIESRFSAADQLEKSIDESLCKTAALKQSLLKQAFEGKLLTEQELE